MLPRPMHAHSSANRPHSKTAWVFIAGLSHDLTEGDVITVFSQFGEVVNINLPRLKQSGKSRGFCFLCYQDLNSTTLAVENLNGITLLGRRLKVDYVENYKAPKYREDAEEELKRLWEEGCAPRPVQLVERKGKESHKKHKVSKTQHKKVKSNKKRNVKEHRIYGSKTIRQTSFTKKSEGLSEVPQEEQATSKESFLQNRRPDFQKADWRDIEIWRINRNHSSREEVSKKMRTTGPDRDVTFIPKRYL